jgi:hypothetical protein
VPPPSSASPSKRKSGGRGDELLPPIRPPPSRSCRRQQCGAGGGHGCANAAAAALGFLVRVTGRKTRRRGLGFWNRAPLHCLYIGAACGVSRAPRIFFWSGGEFILYSTRLSGQTRKSARKIQFRQHLWARLELLLES